MWMKAWLLTAALTAVLLVGAEGTWRALGHRPSVVDDDALWAEQRSRVYRPGAIVLTGMSRIQLDISSEVLAERFGRSRIARLEVSLRHPLSALYDLSVDPDFKGTVIASVSAPWMRPRTYPGLDREFAYYRDRFGWNVRTNRWIASWVQSTLVAVNPLVSLRAVLVGRFSGNRRLPEPAYIITRRDRSRLADYDRYSQLADFAKRIESVSRRRHREKKPTPAQFLFSLSPIEPAVSRIEARGGRVVFVRLPTSGAIWELDQEHYPKARYWDRFAARTRARTLHFKDDPVLAAFRCRDGSHLDSRDVGPFTERLLDVLDL